MSDVSVLPYRTGPEELIRWVEARARGRAGSGSRQEERGAKSLEGTAATAAALSLAAPDGTLTETGRRFALADGAGRRALLREVMLGYAPYRELLAEIDRRGDRETTADWIETWWATHGVGNSGSNRREGAATLGRLAEWAGLGRYIPGRRGHPTRIEWAGPVAEESPPENHPAAAPPRAVSPASPEMNRLAVDLANGATARLELPRTLSSSEKRRLLQLLDLLIREE
jgi:hypothetical protein